jgi:hypothetical protein
LKTLTPVRTPAATKSRALTMSKFKRPSRLVRARARKTTPSKRKKHTMARRHALDLGMLVDQYIKAL